MTRRLLGACLVAMPLLAACAFVMDFDELQKGNGPKATGGSAGQTGKTGGAAGSDASATGGAGGGSGAGGTSGAGGVSGGGGAGGGNCSTGCADTDPCTVDTCTASGCTHTYTQGVFLDGLSDKATAPAFHRVTMAVHGPNFYLSAFETTSSGTEVLFSSFGATDKTSTPARPLSTLGTFNGRVPVSAAGIAAPTNGLELSVFVAMGQTIGQPAQVWELTIDPTLGNVKSAAPAAADDNYAAPATAYPIAWSPSGSDVYAAWPGATSGVYLHRAGAAPEAAGASPVFGASGSKVIDLAPLAAAALPAVLFMDATTAKVQAFGQLLPLSLGDCDTKTGSLTSAVSAYSQVDGIWVGGWTKTWTAGGWVSQTKPVLCGTGSSGIGCIASPRCEMASDQSYPGIRNPAFVFARRSSDPIGRVFEFLALPYVNAGNNSAGIGLQMVQVDFNLSQPDASANAEFITQTPIPIVTTPPGANGAGPDWPVMAYLDPGYLGIAWIQPGATAGQELHVERHKVCFPRATDGG